MEYINRNRILDIYIQQLHVVQKETCIVIRGELSFLGQLIDCFCISFNSISFWHSKLLKCIDSQQTKRNGVQLDAIVLLNYLKEFSMMDVIFFVYYQKFWFNLVHRIPKTFSLLPYPLRILYLFSLSCSSCEMYIFPFPLDSPLVRRRLVIPYEISFSQGTYPFLFCFLIRLL